MGFAIASNALQKCIEDLVEQMKESVDAETLMRIYWSEKEIRKGNGEGASEEKQEGQEEEQSPVSSPSLHSEPLAARAKKRLPARRQRRRGGIKQHRATKSDETFRVAMERLPHIPADRWLLRWMKFQLQRATFEGRSFNRRVFNFGEDLHDGQVLKVLFSCISGKPSGFRDDSYMDDQRRSELVLRDVCKHTLPPFRGLLTAAHIYQKDTLLNAAFLAQLCRQLPHMSSLKGTHARNVLDTLEALLKRWKAVSSKIRALSQPETYASYRRGFVFLLLPFLPSLFLLLFFSSLLCSLVVGLT